MANVPPRPIDASVSVPFNVGAGGIVDSFTVYFREAVVDYVTMIEMNQYTMGELNGRPMPNQGDAKWEPRQIDTLDVEPNLPGVTMDDLESGPVPAISPRPYTLREIERQADQDLSSHFRITVEWGTTGTSIYGFDSEDNGQSFLDVGDLDDNEDYVALIDVEDDTWRVRIYPVALNIIDVDSLVFDTSFVKDDFHLKRRKGELRLATNISEGSDATVGELRTRHLNFAEYRSRPLRSHTPVEGCQIFAEYTPGVQHFTSFVRKIGFEEYDVLPLDLEKSLSGESYKIVNLGTAPNQEFVTNTVLFENFNDYRIEFDIWYPQQALDNDNPVEVWLTDPSDFSLSVKINIGKIVGDSWHHVKFYPVEANIFVTGEYRLMFRQPEDGQATTWWVDNISILEESMRWEARAVADDPWGDQKGTWMHARDLINMENGGLLFHERGTQLQVRGIALRQDVTLGRVKVKPKYAELGRVVFDAQESAVDLVNGVASANTPLYTADLGANRKLDSVQINWESVPAINSDGLPDYDVGYNNEVQRVSTTGTVTSGSFNLALPGAPLSSAIPWNGTAADVEAALVGLPHVAPGDVIVTGGPLPSTPVFVEFAGAWGNQNVTPLSGFDGLVGGSLAVATIRDGGGNGIITFQGSPDNVTYTNLATVQVLETGWQKLIFPREATARYFRVRPNQGEYVEWHDIIIRPQLLSPTADFTPSIVGDTVSFDASTSTDPDGFIVAYVWNFGDGGQGFGKNVVHTYGETGLGYNVTLTVVDNHGNEAIYTEEVGV